MTRRDFLSAAAGATACSLLPGDRASGSPASGAEPAKPNPAGPIRVVARDEQQPAQQKAYANFLGNAIADHLSTRPGFSVKSARLADPEQGLSKQALDNCDVLVWWGHVQHAAVTPETGKAIVQRIKSGQLSLVALHSAHWSSPFVEAMHERATQDALNGLTDEQRKTAQVTFIRPKRFVAPKRNDP